MATPKNTNVYLEAVEEAENEGNKPKEARNTRGVRMYVGKYETRLLASSRKCNT